MIKKELGLDGKPELITISKTRGAESANQHSPRGD